MTWINIVLLVSMLAVAAVALWRHNKTRLRRLPDRYFDLCVPMSWPIHFDPARFMAQFHEHWGLEVSCYEQTHWDAAELPGKPILATDGRSNVLLLVGHEPVETLTREALVDMLTPHLSRNERDGVLTHRSHVMIYVLMDRRNTYRNAMKRSRFAARVLLTFLKYYRATGYVCGPAYHYRSAAGLKEIVAANSVTPEILYLLFVNTHLIDIPDGGWLHTHGMEQLGLPDMEIKFADTGASEHYWDLLGRAAIYCLMRGPVLKIGHTMQFTEGGPVYRIKSSESVEEHEYGEFGGIELAPVQ